MCSKIASDSAIYLEEFDRSQCVRGACLFQHGDANAAHRITKFVEDLPSNRGAAFQPDFDGLAWHRRCRVVSRVARFSYRDAVHAGRSYEAEASVGICEN